MTRPTTPLLTVDIIIEVTGGIVLIERKNPPPGWALPGGFVDVGESLAHAAMREAREETSLEVTLDEQFFGYSDPARDPRGPTVSVVFAGHASGTPRAADDAKNVAVYALDRLPALAFDHAQILEDYRRYRKDGKRPPVTR
ncbi:MAG TPA: NUDIX hydrolase [Polyangia bacterium]|jgi:ADP-ribose pyrophosphatase YjhB (NUDIX family)